MYENLPVRKHSLCQSICDRLIEFWNFLTVQVVWTLATLLCYDRILGKAK